MGDSSYFRFDEDNKNKYIISQSSQGEWVNWRHTAASFVKLMSWHLSGEKKHHLIWNRTAVNKIWLEIVDLWSTRILPPRTQYLERPVWPCDKKTVCMASLTLIFTRSVGILQPTWPLGRVGSKFNWPGEDLGQRTHSDCLFLWLPHT